MTRARYTIGRRAAATLLLAVAWVGASAPGARAAVATLETNVTGLPAGHARHPLDKASQRKIVRTRIGSPQDPFTYVVYTRYSASTLKTEVILARSRTLFLSDAEKLVLFGQSGAAWPNGSDDFAFPAIDISPDGKQLHVVALNLTQQRVVYTKNVSIETAWQTAWTRADGTAAPPRYDLVGASAYATTAPSIAVDENARPHVVWTRPGITPPFPPNVFHVRHDGTNWTGDAPLSSVPVGTAYPEELDPSIDIANGWVHVLYKDDQDTSDAAAKTNRYRYVRNNTQFGYSSYNAAVTVMQPAAGQNDAGLPGSVAARDNGVWITGSFLGGFSNVGYYNYSSDGGTTWALDATGTENDVYECDGVQKLPAPIGLNSEGNDHRLYAIRRDSGTIYTYKWGGATWVDGLGGTCASHSSYVVTGVAATQPDDSLHLSVLKRKLPRENELAYCWYNSNANASPLRTQDTIYCDSYTGATPYLGPRTFHRSIGTRADYGSDLTACPTCTEGLGSSVTTVLGSRTVIGTGTQWRTANRGPGDVFRVSSVNYMVTAVLSDTELVTEQPISFGGGSGLGYSLRRQETRLQNWANCIAKTGACRFFNPTTSSLVADDRAEIGYAYDDSPFLHSTSGNGAGLPVLRIDGATTSAARDITLTAVGPNRHYGLPGTGVVVDAETSTGGGVWLFDDHVTVEWLEIKGGSGPTAHGIVLGAPPASNQFNVRYNLVHDVGGNGIDVYQAPNANLLLANNIVHTTGGYGVYLDPTPFGWSGQVQVLNNTVANTNGGNSACYKGVGGVGSNTSHVLLANNIGYFLAGTADDFDFPDSDPADGWADVNPASRRNLSSDSSATRHNVTPGGPVSGGTVNYVSFPLGNLHLNSPSDAIDGGADLSSLTTAVDIDAQGRPSGAAWDIGADEFGSPTAVRLMSFAAIPGDGTVTLEWRTGSELDNLGFHVYRGPSADGPWSRLTSSLIPGLGSSPIGQSYSWMDGGLANGVTYYYRLEDVDTSSVSTFHGPVSATPQGATPPPSGGGGSGGGTGSTSTTCPSWVLAALGTSSSGPVTCTPHGDPDAVSLQVVSRDARGATLELRTGGFWALREPSGTVRVFVPGFDTPSDSSAPALPLRRALIDAEIGKKVRLVSAEALDLLGFKGLRPSAVGVPEMAVSWDGTVRPARRAVAAPRLSRGYLPQFVARLAGTVFQGETKSAVVEMTPVRFDGYRQQLVLASRVRVRLSFTGREAEETGAGSTGRVIPRKPTPFREVLAQLHTSRRGLHAVSFEDLFPSRQRGMAVAQLRLQRQGQAVGFHVEPATGVFGPGSVLYFFAGQTASSTDYSSEVAWELVRQATGQAMGVVLGTPDGSSPASPSKGFASFETNRIYQAGLLEAPDVWLWEGMVGGNPARTVSFALSGVEGTSTQPAQLVVDLQGGSESGTANEHHVQVSLNGAVAGEGRFAGKKPYRLSLSVPPSQLLEGLNSLSLVNVGDTGVYSLAFLDRVSVSFPQKSRARSGVFEGAWAEGGTVEVGGVSASPVVLDVADSSSPDGAGAPRNDRAVANSDVAGTSTVRWLIGVEAAPGSVRFRAEAGHRYVVVSREGLLAPRIERPVPSTLRDAANQADYLLIAPRGFLPAAEPLLARRESQGLTTMAVAFEEIAEVFGQGQPKAEAIRDFLAYAYHSWSRPSPRYVVLLGDASYDPRHFLTTSWVSPLPALWAKTSYLWTVSDPALAAVNGTDAIPDLAIGRLPAQTPAEAEALVSKLLAWEDSGQDLGGKAVLVADDPDTAGDFEADVEDIQQSFLSGRTTQLLRLRELGASTRPAILNAFDDGASLVSYVGHGGAAVWASENVLNSWDMPSLQAQSQQPLVLTMNCLSGYFVAPNFDSLSEALLKAEGRGAVAALSPSGLSLDGPAHRYHRAVVAEITGGGHERLGDAILAAQKAYAATGVMPELLSVYQLLGDPATRIR